MGPGHRPSSILFENAAGTVVVVDVPRSIEEAQQSGLELPGEQDEQIAGTGQRRRGRRRRLVSSVPPAEPFPVPPEPGHATGQEDRQAQLAELTAAASVTAALDDLQQSGFGGPWCLPRVNLWQQPQAQPQHAEVPPSTGAGDDSDANYIPPGARYWYGSIAACREYFLAESPAAFDLIVLDPPWPNRSARRRRHQVRRRQQQQQQQQEQSPGSVGRDKGGTDAGYETARDMQAMRALLQAVPVGAKLASADTGGGLVAVWVTNKPACAALLTDPRRGLFREWGVELVAEWTWLKVTTAGAPVVAVDAQWRKPWERLLLARRLGRGGGGAGGSGSGSGNSSGSLHPPPPPIPPGRVIVAVPDVHSRKPHLWPLLAPFLLGRSQTAPPTSSILALEVFARNLTADWWAWGDEVLLFQNKSWWREEDTVDDNADGFDDDKALNHIQ